MIEENEKNTPEAGQQKSMSETIKGKDWEKLLFVLLLSVVLYLEVVYVSFLLVLVSVIRYLVKGSMDPRISNFSDALITVVNGTLRYILFRTEDKPWPLRPWPATGMAAGNDSAGTAEKVAEKLPEDAGERPSEH
jgi:hypothetical protein